MSFCRYEGQRDMLYNQTFNLDQVAFASEGIKDAQQTVGFTLCYEAYLLPNLLPFSYCLSLSFFQYIHQGRKNFVCYV